MKEVMTYKSGKFYLTDAFDKMELTNELVRVHVLNETIVELPILPTLATQLNSTIMYSSIAGTAAIEENSITEKDVERISKGEDVDEYTHKDIQEIKNLINAYNKYLLPSKCNTPFLELSEILIREVHAVITVNVPHERNSPGMYRNGRVEVGDKAHGGVVYVPPKILDDIRALMKEFIEWINSDDMRSLSPLVRAPLAHYYIGAIHPFWDGNGRTARLIEAMILQAGGIKHTPKELSNYYYRNVDEYYIAFSKTNKLKRDITPFMSFFLKAAVKSMENIKARIIYFIRIFSLRDYYTYKVQEKKITKRQFELLSLLLDALPEYTFTLKDLFTKLPFSILYSKVSHQTARRDLRKLTDMGLLSSDGDGNYSLDLYCLD